ncbi:UDP-glucosyltransferase 29-like [Carya illinoinensis]|uniref:Glycosyltransferase n=1 Tax=Carya illinoinensis TaxID=32201 RepID=A0A8T1NII1_CARIL|nr:UDP-glucosyltransferase 29-like [Carya illinoinensis]KAG6628670.1 hypothetical protein CIPAW_14G029300 [Carya illinoinensis]KAG6677531.1 hypothetical protein I3842_14G032100 [Carya illinoinensis]
MDTAGKRIRVVMLPWLAHGHISPFLELSKKLAKRNFHIYFCSTPVNLSSIKPKLSAKYSRSIQLVELHLPSLPELPPQNHTTKGLPPHLNATLKRAFDMAGPHFSNILKTLSPDLLIYDFLQPWAPAIAASQNIPAINFLSTGAAMTSFVLHAMKKPGDEFPFPEIHLDECMTTRFVDLPEDNSPSNDHHHISDKDRALKCFELSSGFVMMKTFEELEGKYISFLSHLMQKKIVPVGPLIQNPVRGDNEKAKTLEWLDKRKQSSAVFVSFGSEYFLSKEEMEEIAYGLELSNVNFIWVVRFPEGEKVKLEEALPEGFLQRVGEKGMVVEGWAPQAKILMHPSIGGFVSHCGWSSVMESIDFGVPIVAIPMQLDQPVNAKVVEEAGVGVEVKRDRDGKLEREEVATAIREVVMGNIGESVRKKEREMRDNIRKKGEEKMDGVAQELVQLHGNGIKNV